VSVVRDNTELNRFEMDTEAGLAIADYRLNGFTVTIYHTEVPTRLRGRGAWRTPCDGRPQPSA
jgi:uncharacterized protein